MNLLKNLSFAMSSKIAEKSLEKQIRRIALKCNQSIYFLILELEDSGTPLYV